LVSLAVLVALAAAAAAAPPTIQLTPDQVTLTNGDHAVRASLADGRLTVTTPSRPVSLTVSILDGRGWTTPHRAVDPPAAAANERQARVTVGYPVSGQRLFTIDLSARADLPAIFVASRLDRLDHAGDEYYYWSTDVSFDRYWAPAETRIDPAVWTTIAWRPWLYLPTAAAGGLAILPTNACGRGPTAGGTLFLHAVPRSTTVEPGTPLPAAFGLAAVTDAASAADLASRARAAGLPALPTPPPPPGGFGPAAPEWLRQAEVYNLYYRPAAQWTDAIVDQRLRGLPFVVGSTPDKAALDRCHRAGVRLLHYVCYTCLLDTTLQVAGGGQVYSEWSESIDSASRDLKDHPDWVCIDAKSQPQHDAWGLAHHHPGLLNTCLHQPGLHAAALRQVRLLMDLGYDGVFIDLAGPTVECYGDKFGLHKHEDGAASNTAAYEQLLSEIYQLVKSYGPDRVVFQNTCTALLPRHWACCDLQMLEAQPFGEDSPEVRATWPELAWFGQRLAPALAAGKCPALLPYLSRPPRDRLRQAALYSWVYAHLYDWLWADGFTLLDRPDGAELAHDLYITRLGRPLTAIEPVGEALSRRFEHGLALLNPTEAPLTVTVEAPGAGVRDLGYGRQLAVTGGQARLELDPRSGRALCW
jgi:hypothetical protein